MATPEQQQQPSTTATSPAIALRQPTLSPPSSPPSDPTLPPPLLSWIEGTWHVTHSTLPMWKKNRNVQIRYTRNPTASPAPHSYRLHDEVTYQALGSSKVKSVVGIDKPVVASASSATVAQTDGSVDSEVEPRASLAYNWRGKGLLFIASSQWQILGYGEEAGTGNRWVVTYFAKTLFTPEGLDIYSRDKVGLRADTVADVRKALEGLGGNLTALAKGIFEVKIDGDR